MPVLEALVAIGLAGNVVQFCETAAGVASQAIAIRRQGKPASLSDLRGHGEKAVKLAEIILEQISVGSGDLSTLPEEDRYLVTLATECKDAGHEFLGYLYEYDIALQATTSNSKSKRTSLAKSLKTSIKFRWDHHKITDFTDKLDQLREVLTLSATLALRRSAEAHSSNVVTHLKQLQSQSDGNSALLQTLAAIFQTENETTRRDVQIRIEQCLDSIHRVKPNFPQTREAGILRWLNFRQITWRYEEVPPAFENTFRWLYETRTAKSEAHAVWDDFKAHLEGSEVRQPYWINGKAGSGKSTLMKFIVDRKETKRALKEWAGDDELMILKFFFWNLGTTLQKSVAGMLRTLLLAILEKHPELIPAAFPSLYQVWNDREANIAPSYIELKKALMVVLERSAPFLKLCIYIDGIDELDGDHRDLSEFLKSLPSTSPATKLVVSSRPITGCIRTFEGCPSLRLQDLTVEDMRLFIKANLSKHQSMLALAQIYPRQARDLEQEIGSMSNGVFLWVKIVVKLLLDGLESGDTIDDLKRKLRALPPDLKDLYNRMMSKMSPEHQSQASEIFLLFHAWNTLVPDQPLQTLTLALATEFTPEAIHAEPEALDVVTAKWKRDHIEARIRSRCCGLLEVYNAPMPHDSVGTCIDASRSSGVWRGNFQIPFVQYLHRTVAEFILSEDVLSEICRRVAARPQMKLVLALCRASISMLKSQDVSRWEFVSSRDDTFRWVRNIFALCRGPNLSDADLERMVQHVDGTMYQHMENASWNSQLPSLQESPPAHWSVLLYGLQDIAKECPGYLQLLPRVTLFCTAAREGLVQYLRTASSLSTLGSHSRFAVAAVAIKGWQTLEGVPLQARSDTLSYLLRSVAKPESSAFGNTLWALAADVMSFLIEQKQPPSPVDAAEMMRIFLVTMNSPRLQSQDPRSRLLKGNGTTDGRINPLVARVIRALQSSSFDGINNTRGYEVKLLGQELRCLAISELPGDDVSQTFTDIVMRASAASGDPSSLASLLGSAVSAVPDEKSRVDDNRRTHPKADSNVTHSLSPPEQFTSASDEEQQQQQQQHRESGYGGQSYVYEMSAEQTVQVSSASFSQGGASSLRPILGPSIGQTQAQAQSATNTYRDAPPSGSYWGLQTPVHVQYFSRGQVWGPSPGAPPQFFPPFQQPSPQGIPRGPPPGFFDPQLAHAQFHPRGLRDVVGSAFHGSAYTSSQLQYHELYPSPDHESGRYARPIPIPVRQSQNSSQQSYRASPLPKPMGWNIGWHV